MTELKTEFPDFYYGYLKRYGAPKRSWYSQVHTALEVVTVANVAGKGALYMGVLAIASDEPRWTDKIEIIIDGVTVFSDLWGWLWLYRLYNIPNYPLSIVSFDYINHYYTAVVECNYTFDETMVVTYELKDIAGNTTVNFELLYGELV